MILELTGSIAIAPMFNTGRRSVRTFHVVPASVVFHPPPVTEPAYMIDGLCGSMRRLRVLPPMFPGPRLVHPDVNSAPVCSGARGSPGLANENVRICRMCSRAASYFSSGSSVPPSPIRLAMKKRKASSAVAPDLTAAGREHEAKTRRAKYKACFHRSSALSIVRILTREMLAPPTAKQLLPHVDAVRSSQSYPAMSPDFFRQPQNPPPTRARKQAKMSLRPGKARRDIEGHENSGDSPEFSTERMSPCNELAQRSRERDVHTTQPPCVRDCEKTRGHCCRTLTRKGFPKLPQSYPAMSPDEPRA